VLSKDHMQRLEDFNELAENLINSRFIKKSKEKDPRRRYLWRLNEQTGNLDYSYSRDRIHDEEAIMAFVLMLRQFIQDKDRTSIKKMANLYEDMLINGDYKIEFRSLRTRFNDYLDSPAIITTADDPTMEQILRTMIYGKYAHMEDTKREVLKRWREYEGDWDMIVGEFEAILFRCADTISSMKELNEQVLKQYSSHSRSA
jgi:hypothetical protein